MNQYLKKAFWLGSFIFLFLNLIAFAHAYKFTHFTTSKSTRTKDPKELTVLNKINILLTGVDNPRPRLKAKPRHSFKTITLFDEDSIKCWSIKVPNAKGTVILFHGYAGEKSSLIGQSSEFLALGYNTFLVDFIGSGGSGGTSTSVGFREADQVRICFEYIQNNEGKNKLYLFGTSIGAVATLKAISDFNINPTGIILECPFGSLYKTVCARFNLMGVPSFPMAGLLTFWGGVQHGYWAFSHNPIEYAKAVTCPTLLLFGEQDNRVSAEEINSIFHNLKGYKVLKTYPKEGHLVFAPTNSESWKNDVSSFMSETR